MTTSAALPDTRCGAAVDPIAAFKLRCEARAHLYSQGEMDLHEAVDVLQESAPPSLSTDAPQAIMAEAFKKVREKEWSAENAAHMVEKPNSEAPPETETAANAAPASTVEFNPPSPTKLRLRNLWLATMAVRDKGNYDELQKHFMELARENGLVKAAAEHHAVGNRPRKWGEEDVAHVIRWGLRGMNPWCPGEFPNE